MKAIVRETGRTVVLLIAFWAAVAVLMFLALFETISLLRQPKLKAPPWQPQIDEDGRGEEPRPSGHCTYRLHNQSCYT